MGQRQNPPDQRGNLQKLLDRLGLSWRLMLDRRVDLLSKLIPIATAIYILSPIDFIPEAIFGPLGLVDDIGIAILGLEFFIRMAPPGVVQEHLMAIKGRFQQHQRQESPEEDIIEGNYTKRN